MSRVNVYMKAVNDAGRTVSMGGRGQSNSVHVLFNTDNAQASNVALSVSAMVRGSGLTSAERRKKDGDQRRTLFRIELPEPSRLTAGCEVQIEASGKPYGAGFENVFLPGGITLAYALACVAAVEANPMAMAV